MAKFTKGQVDIFKSWIDEDLAMIPLREGLDNREDILTKEDAWALVKRCGLLAFAKRDRSITEQQIESAMKEVFPNLKG